MTKAIDACRHQWTLAVVTNPYVYCPQCLAQFKPENQTLIYHGIIPTRFQK